MADRYRQFGPRVQALGDGFAMSATSKTVLRAIRNQVDDNGTFYGGAQDVMRLTGLSFTEAEGGVIDIATRGFVRVRRRRA